MKTNLKEINSFTRQLDISIAWNLIEEDYHNEFNRGVYFCLMYKNGKEFLRNEIDEQDLVPDERCEYDWIVNWWKEKAIRRYLNLHSKNNISFNNYWFDNMTKKDVDQYLTSGGVVVS